MSLVQSIPILDQIYNITPNQFEQLCKVLLEATGFTDLFLRKASTQTGRDIDAKIIHPSSDNLERWFFECKQYKGTVPFKEIVDKFYLINRLSPIPDALVILSTGALSNNVNDFLENYAEDLDFPILKITNEPPEYRFNNWVLEHQDKALVFLSSISQTDKSDTATDQVTMDLLVKDQSILQHPTFRIERALRLNAYPRLIMSWNSISGYFNSIKLTISNIGNGFADEVSIIMLHNDVIVSEPECGPISSNSFFQLEIKPNINIPLPVNPNGESIDTVTFVLTYRNALNYTFQSTYQIVVDWVNNSHNYGKARKVS